LIKVKQRKNEEPAMFRGLGLFHVSHFMGFQALSSSLQATSYVF